MRWLFDTLGIPVGIIAISLIVSIILSILRVPINFLPIVFAVLAFVALREALRVPDARRALGGLHGCVWLLVIAACMAFGSAGTFITLGIIASIFLGTFSRSIGAFLLDRNTLYHPPARNTPPPTPYYQPSRQSPEQPYKSYEQGYQPAKSEERSSDVPLSSSPSNQYEQPQAQYPQQMPPQ